MGGRWEYTLAEAAREEARFEPMETYIWQSQNTVTQYIVTQPIMDLYEVGKRKRGPMWVISVGNGREFTSQGQWRCQKWRQRWKNMIWRNKGRGG